LRKDTTLRQDFYHYYVAKGRTVLRKAMVSYQYTGHLPEDYPSNVILLFSSTSSLQVFAEAEHERGEEA
jgi:hypothetical protein